MSYEKYREEKFLVLDENNGYLFCSKGNEYIILKPNTNNKFENKKLGNIEYISRFESYDGNTYELIIFDNSIKEEIARSFFDILVKVNKDLPKTLDEINIIFSSIYNSMELWKKRGIFAELYSIVNYNLIPKIDKNSIYDMSTVEGLDVEIKSFSKTKRDVEISYQQLTNNDKALFYMFEVIETSNGKSIIDMYKELSPENKERYKWIESIKSYNDKFDINKEQTIICSADKLNKNLSIPSMCKNAYFIYSVDLIKGS